MKRFLMMLFFIPVMLFSYGESGTEKVSEFYSQWEMLLDSSSDSFSVEFYNQNDQQILPLDGVITLDAEAFTIRFYFETDVNLCVNISENERFYDFLELYNSLRTDFLVKPLSDVWTDARGMAEYSYNVDKTLFSTEEAYHYFYFSAEYHRFNRLEYSGDFALGYRDVDFIGDLSVSDCSGMIFYFTVVKSNSDENEIYILKFK